jgi:MFS family permease
VVASTIFGLCFNLYMSALGFGNDAIGLFNALPALAILLVGLPVGALADRLGYRPFLLASAFLSTGAAFLLAVSSSSLVALLSAGSYALGLTLAAILTSPILARLSSAAGRTALYSFNEALGWLGGIPGFLLGGYVPELTGRILHLPGGSAPALRGAWLAMAALQLLALPFLMRVAGSPKLPERVTSSLALMLQIDYSRFVRLLGPYALLGLGAGMLLNFLQLYLSQRFRLSPGPIGLVLAGAALPTAYAALRAPRLARRFGISRTIALGQLAGAPLVFGLALARQLPVALILLYVRQAALNIQAPLNQVFSMELVDEQERARLASAQELVWGLTFAGAGPLLSGVLQVHGGFELAFGTAGLFYLVAGLTFLFLFGSTRVASDDASLGHEQGKL